MRNGGEFKTSEAVQYGRATLRREDMLLLKSEFDYVRGAGLKTQTKSAILLVAESPDNKTRFGVICGRKFDKRAVVRNRARRLIKEAFRRVKERMLKRHLVFIPKRGVCSLKTQEVQKQIIEALKQNNLWIEPKQEASKIIEVGENDRRGCVAAVLIGLIRVYQFLTPWINCCRFNPSCSEYAALVLKKHGALKGLILTIYRLLRCQPYCRGGYDPPPEKFSLKLSGRKKEKNV